MIHVFGLTKGLPVVFILVFCPRHVSAKRVSSTISNTYPQPLHGIGRDPFVENAPLAIAVACRDGVAVVTAVEPSAQNKQQYNSNHSISDSEPLMYYTSKEIKDITQKQRDDNATSFDEDDGYPFLDLPDTFSGSYRILSATSDGRHSTSVFVSCGWKVDGYIQLRNAGRDIVDNERYTFGSVENEEIPIHFLANQLSLYMAQCAASERFRTLSCTALVGGINSDLYTGSNDPFGTNSNAFGSLWFIDVTGAYPVRAHCMGGGSISVKIGKHRDLQIVPLADYINQELLYQFRRIGTNKSSISQPYFDMTTNEALIMILDLLSMKDQRPNSHTIATSILLPPKTRLELLCISSTFSNTNASQGRRRMVRKRISDIWGMKKKNSRIV